MRTRGYAKIENRLLEALAKIDLKVYEYKVLLAILRKTYGWDKDSDRIPGSQIVKLTGIKKSNVSRTIKGLIKKGVITKKGNKLGIERDFSKWKKLSLGITIEKVISGEQKVISGDNKKLSLERPSIEKPKERPQQKGNVATQQLSRKEIDKLEGYDWFRAEMIADGGFTDDWIDDLIKANPFSTLMDCWYVYREAEHIKNKPGFFLSLVEKHREQEEQR